MTNPFSKTTLWVVIGVAIASLIVTVVLTVIGSDPTLGSIIVELDRQTRSIPERIPSELDRLYAGFV